MKKLAAVLLLACAHSPSSPPPSSSPSPSAWSPAAREAALASAAAAIWSGRLGEAHEALLAIADRERGFADPALDFWSELLALLRCEPVPASISSGGRSPRDPWSQLRRLVQIERIRVDARAGEGSDGLRPSARRVELGAVPGDVVVWPVEAERWSDEAPLARAIADYCRLPPELAAGGPAPGAKGAAKTQAATPAPAPAAEAPAFAVTVTAGAVRPPRARAPRAEWPLVAGLTGALPEAHPALPDLLLEQAVLALDEGDATAALHALGRLAPAAAPVGPATPATGGAAAATTVPPDEVALVWAVAADTATQDDGDARAEAIARLTAALAFDWPPSLRRALAFRLGEQLRAAGRPDEAAAAIGPPPHGDDLLGRYLAYAQAAAHAKAGRRAEALAEARAALGKQRRAAVDADPALAAIDDVAVRLLLGSPLQAETMEVLESLGAPGERLARVDRFAQMAMTSGVFASGMGAFLWLAENEPDPQRRLHHLARASVAAARAGDGKQFARTFALLAGQEDEDPSDPLQAALTNAPRKHPAPSPSSSSSSSPASPPPGLIASAEGERLYRTRRRELSLGWQRALLVVARDALPSLVDNDDQANLKILVDRLQRHLTSHGRGPVDAELTTVYRAASAHLRDGARGYAERVGSAKRPLLLGDVAVARRLPVPPPLVTITPRGPRALLWVPRTGVDPSPARLARWSAPLGVSLLAQAGGAP